MRPHTSRDIGEGRRVGARRKVIQEVCLFDESGEPIVLETIDIGPRGIFVRSDLLLEPGQDLWISFNIPDGQRLVVKGRVIRGDLGGEGKPSGMGIDFIDLTPQEEGLLRKFSYKEQPHQSAWQMFLESAEASTLDALPAK